MVGLVDFLRGVLFGVSIGVMLLAVILTARQLALGGRNDLTPESANRK